MDAEMKTKVSFSSAPYSLHSGGFRSSACFNHPFILSAVSSKTFGSLAGPS
jgi:hypothetical protein